MNKKQIVVLWLSISLLLPLLYFGGKQIIEYRKDLEFAELGVIPDPTAKQPSEYRVRLQQRHFVEMFGLLVFEMVSATGLLIFVFRSQKKPA